MSIQTLLPFGRQPFNPKHLLWVKQANAAEYGAKKGWFYPFKTRLCQRFATFDGYDKQVIRYTCYRCHGTGMDHGRICPHCRAGIYDEKMVWLVRWALAGDLFHQPTFWRLDGTRHGDYKEVISGYVRHTEHAQANGERAMLRLLLRYEPNTYLQFWYSRWRDFQQHCTYRTRWHIRRVKALFEKQTTDDNDVPF